MPGLERGRAAPTLAGHPLRQPKTRNRMDIRCQTPSSPQVEVGEILHLRKPHDELIQLPVISSCSWLTLALSCYWGPILGNLGSCRAVAKSLDAALGHVGRLSGYSQPPPVSPTISELSRGHRPSGLGRCGLERVIVDNTAGMEIGLYLLSGTD